jgi:ABC-type phosphate transport system substrate-binding protein
MKLTVWRNHRIGLASLVLTLNLGSSAASADVVAVVSADSPITALSKTQVIDIFLGRRSRFPDGSSAVPIDQIEGSTAREDFYARFAAMSPAQLKAFWSKIIFTGRGQPPSSVATSRDVKKLLLARPNTIGYMDQSMVDSSLKVILAP